MKMRYLRSVASLEMNGERCTGCGVCLSVCPRGVFVRDGRRVRIADLDVCIECGACAKNCEYGALSVRSGVGCAAAFFNARRGGEATCCGEGDGCC